MEYGLIGEKLGHSFSREIHNLIGEYDYALREVAKEEFEDFIAKRDFKGINVTIPYKRDIMPFLHEIDENARAIGAVNAVINDGGKLKGYNTDFLGLCSLVKHSGISLDGKKVLVLGTGGTSNTAEYTVRVLGAKEVVKVGRRAKENCCTYEEAYSLYGDADVIINTTPVGMYPDNESMPINLERFQNLQGVIDVVYNPLKTRLILEAEKREIRSIGGLFMLVSQAVEAARIFTGKSIDKGLEEKIYQDIKRGKQNIVLIGMPSSGKTSVGKALANMLGKQFIDTDEEIVKREGMEINEIFSRFGEARFREIESEVIGEFSKKQGSVIATGGGAVLDSRNVENLRLNGEIYFLDRPIELLTPTADRPTASDKEAIKMRFDERYEIYLSSCDKRIYCPFSVAETVEKITEDFNL